MRCKNCGNELPFNSNFCPKCGAKNQNNEHLQNGDPVNKTVSNDTNNLVVGIISIALFVILIGIIQGKFTTVYADSYNGKCGTNTTWEVNTDTRTITISGSGEMNDYILPCYDEEGYRPWVDYIDYIQNVKIGNDVTNVGNYAFMWHYNLANVKISGSVTSIGDHSFFGCENLKDVYISNGTNSINKDAFAGCKGLKSIRIPKTLKSIGTDAFFYCNNMAVYYEGSEEEWKNIEINGGNTFKNIIYNYDCDKSGHDYITVTTPATTSKAGSIITKCTKCGMVKNSENIAKIMTVSLSPTSYLYDGKEKRPSVVVKDGNHKPVASENYTITYENNKYVGKATATVKFKGCYHGIITKEFVINPKMPVISKIQAKKKGFKVVWKKAGDQITGYEIQYTLNKKFSKKSVRTTKSTKFTAKKLKSKKRYYVRIRVYKKVGNKKYYSEWSKIKKIITKK